MSRQLQTSMWGGLLIATTVAVGLTMMALGAAQPVGSDDAMLKAADFAPQAGRLTPQNPLQQLTQLQQQDLPAGEGGAAGGAPQTCPPNTQYGQSPHQDADAWTFGTADTGPAEQYKRFESFPVPGGPICDIHWWGADLMFDPAAGWIECDEDPMPFTITFYNDDGTGMPDQASPLCTYNVSVTGVPGPVYSGFVTQKYYSVNLAPMGCCSGFTTAAGWVSIQGQDQGEGCWFLWLSSPTGDGSSVLYDGIGKSVEAFDLSLCLTGATGACGPGTGDCCIANGTPGCDDATCCNAICAIDPFCCDVAWDGACAAGAAADPVNCPQCVGGPPNDECAGALPISNGNTAYDMTGATFDATDCFVTGFPSIYYDYTANFTGDLTIRVCDDLNQTGIEVYDGCGCPTNAGDLLACDSANVVDPACGSGVRTEVTVPVVNGGCYKIRLTTILESTGTITITKSLADGACCIAMDCVILAEPECLAKGGVYQGDGTTCGGGQPISYNSFPNAPLPDGDPVGVSDTIVVPDSFSITDLNVGLQVEHTFVGDLCVRLVHQPTGTTVDLIQRMGAVGPEPCHFGSPFGCSADNMSIVLDDQGAGGLIENACAADLPSPPNYVPNNPLAAFNSLDSAGAWTLNVSDNAGADLGTFVSWALIFPGGGKNPCAGPGEVNFFFNQGPFEDAVAAAGKVLKGIEDFEEANVPDGTCSGINDPLDASTDNGIFFPGDILCNLAFQSNLDSPGVNGPNPRGIEGMVACGPGAGQGSADKAVSANFFADSTDILSLNPNHTAMALRIADIGGAPGPIEVRVFDKNEVLLGGVTIPTTLPGTFIGFVMKDQQTFGRVNLSSTGAVGTETIYIVRAYVSPNLSPCPWDLNGDNSVGILDLLALLAAWGPNPGDPANFDGDCSVGILDLLALLAHWGPCPASTCVGETCDTYSNTCDPNDPGCTCFTLFDGSGFCGGSVGCGGLTLCPDGNCPPGFVCQVDTCCGPDPICVPAESECGGVPLAPPPPGTKTTTGIAGGDN